MGWHWTHKCLHCDSHLGSCHILFMMFIPSTDNSSTIWFACTAGCTYCRNLFFFSCEPHSELLVFQITWKMSWRNILKYRICCLQKSERTPRCHAFFLVLVETRYNNLFSTLERMPWYITDHRSPKNVINMMVTWNHISFIISPLQHMGITMASIYWPLLVHLVWLMCYHPHSKSMWYSAESPDGPEPLVLYDRWQKS